MHAKTPDEHLDDLEPTYDTTGMFGPEWEKAWLEEIKRRRADPAARVTIDAEEAFEKLDDLLKLR